MIVLASKSASRRSMLDSAGVAYETLPADVDERAIEANLNRASGSQIALTLSRVKAEAVSTIRNKDLVLGSDSLVVVGGARFDKPQSRSDAAQHLRAFSGKVMELNSAAAIYRGGQELWSGGDIAQLSVRELSDEFIDSYLEAEWPEVSYCAGVFRIEAMGVQLFEQIEGDMFTVLGMPLLQVLGALRDLGELEK